MKKIWFLNSTLKVGGAERMAYEIIRGLDRSRFQVKAFCLYEPGFFGERLMSEGINFRHGFMRNKYDVSGIFRFLSMLKNELPDVLYMEASPLTLFWGFICGKMARVPFMTTIIHSMKPSLKLRIKMHPINRFILKRLDKIGVVSVAKLKDLVKTYRLDPSKVELIHNAIDLKRFSDMKNADYLREKLGLSEKDRVVGMVGRLVKEKAFDIFLRSARCILNSVPNAKFLIVGEGSKRSELEKLSEDLGITRHVIFLGERQDIPEIISLFEIAVLSSRIESFPLVLLEYMALSKPIVATSVGGNAEIIADGETGVLVPPENPGAIAEAVTVLLMDRRKSKNMGFKARQLLENKFSLEPMMNKIEKLFYSNNHNIKNDKIHVLLVGPALDVKGGVSSFARYFLEAETLNGFKVIYNATTVDGNKILKSFYFIKSLASYLFMLIFDKKIKIVHISSSSKGSFYRKSIMLLIAKIFRKKTMFHIHGASFDVFYSKGHPIRRCCMRKILDLTDMPIALSSTWLSAISKMTRNNNIKIMHHYIDTADFKFEKSAKNEKQQFNVFTAGRLEKRKGTYDILKAVQLVLKEAPEARFYLAGDGDLNKASDMCKKYNIDRNVHILGWLDRRGLIEALSKADIFLLPSYHEGLPIAIIEAMAAGLPVISTKVGGIPEAIEDGINGFLIDPGDIKAMSERILTLLKDRELRDRMSRANIEKAESMFGLEKTICRFYEEYENLLNSKG